MGRRITLRTGQTVGGSNPAGDIHTYFCPPPFAKAGDIKTHWSVLLFVCPFVCLSVCHKIFNLAYTSEVLMIEYWYLACMILVSPFDWHHLVTLTFDILQDQSCCRAGEHNSLNLLINLNFSLPSCSSPPGEALANEIKHDIHSE